MANLCMIYSNFFCIQLLIFWNYFTTIWFLSQSKHHPFRKNCFTSTKRKLNCTKSKNKLVKLKKVISYQNYHSLNELPRIGSGSVWIFVVHNIVSIFLGFEEPTDVVGWWLTFLMMMYTISQEVFEPAPLNSEIVELFTMPRSFDKIFLRLLFSYL